MIKQKQTKLTIVKKVDSLFYYTSKGYKKERKRVLCKCDCGNNIEVDLNNILSMATKSCGCLKKEKLPIARQNSYNKRKVVNSGIKKLFRNYKYTALRKNLDFLIDYDFFFNMSQKHCNYCGIEPSLKVKNETGSIYNLVNGLDRVDNSKGYIVSNLVTCCSKCNYAKRNMTKEDFLNLINRIYEFQSDFLKELYPNEKGR